MLLRRRDELGLDTHDAVFIGDSISDIRAGLSVGIQTVLVLSGLGLEQLCTHAREANGPFSIALDLQHAVELIVKGLYLPTALIVARAPAITSMRKLSIGIPSCHYRNKIWRRQAPTSGLVIRLPV
jgi:hypothetical protein